MSVKSYPSTFETASKVKMNEIPCDKGDSPLGRISECSTDTQIETPAIIHSASAIKDITDNTYQPFFSDLKPGACLFLEYPTKGCREKFLLVEPFEKLRKLETRDLHAYNPLDDIHDTMLAIAMLASNPNDKEKILNEDTGIRERLREAMENCDSKQFGKAVHDFNNLIRDMRERNAFKTFEIIPKNIVKHILYQTYSRVVSPDVEKLGAYDAFSNEVYGELNFKLINDFIKKAEITKDSLFLDMGSGIGNVVLQIAAQIGCKSRGVEIMNMPAHLSNYQKTDLEGRLKMYGLPAIDVEFYLGSFMDHPKVLELLGKADVLLINNYVFAPELNLEINDLFKYLKDGCRIISLWSFAHRGNKRDTSLEARKKKDSLNEIKKLMERKRKLNSDAESIVPEIFEGDDDAISSQRPLTERINLRNYMDSQSILQIKYHKYMEGWVSWTRSPGNYLVHTVDRLPLKLFLKKNIDNLTIRQYLVDYKRRRDQK